MNLNLMKESNRIFFFLVFDIFTDQLSHIHIFKFTLANLVFELKTVLEVYYLLYNSMKIPQNARGRTPKYNESAVKVR